MASQIESFDGAWSAAGPPSLHALRNGHPVGRAAFADGHSEADALAMVNVAMHLDVLRRNRVTAELMGPTSRVLVLDGAGHFRPATWPGTLSRGGVGGMSP